MHHDTWGLMQSHFYWPYWRSDSSHHNEPALRGYQLLLSMIQGTQVLIRYIQGSTAQLVKHKALNLVDVGSSPMVELHHMMLFSMKHDCIYKDLTHHIVMSRPLGATYCCSSLHDHIYKVPAHYCINNPALGGYIGWSFYEYKAITSPRLLQAWQPDTWGLHNMEYSVS